MASNLSQPTEPAAPLLECEKEVRFAVVMYGGVSLAIYINGVAQELLSLVRATAPISAYSPTPLSTNFDSASGPALRANERVYRKVSHLLSSKDERMKVARRNKGETDEQFKNRLKQLEEEWLADADSKMKGNEVIHTRFIVDIISGTSAGGINGIFLAKALANDEEMSQLQQLWIDEGDIELLINDRRSVEDAYSLQKPPASLLNSQRMYVKLLNAMINMDQTNHQTSAGKSDKCASPYHSELDLFVTSTDIQGVSLPIKLADDLVFERRYKNVFHFRYSNRDKRNDFECRYNPFLAYAARCTSSFPFAFEPMMLRDIDDVLGNFRLYGDKETYSSDGLLWKKFYKHYETEAPITGTPFHKRAFGDGGYLDNKPFSYATETLMRRTASVPVQRKLIYIEPSPEHPENQPDRDVKPDFVENVMAALFALPRYETIREDLQRVLERNRLITRLQRILRQLDQDIEKATEPSRRKGLSEERLDAFAPPLLSISDERQKDQANLKGKLLTDAEWEELDMADMVERKARPYVAYQRLEIAVVTDNLATMIAAVLGYRTDSDYFRAIRSLIAAWRDDRFTEYHKDDKHTCNRFLLRFDVTYSLRRLAFVRDKINERLRDTKTTTEARKELLSLREFITEQYDHLFDFSLDLTAGSLRDLDKRVRDMEITEDLLDKILKDDPSMSVDTGDYTPRDLCDQQEMECKGRALQRLKEGKLKPALDHVAELLESEIYSFRHKSDEACLDQLIPGRSASVVAPAGEAAEIRNKMRWYYQNYDEYDMFILPLQQGTDIGESAVTEVTRISPEDATHLINEKDWGCMKLAGTALGNFGGFLEQSWRQNDILWGRLDGAERLISTLLPDEQELAERLIGEAQRSILCEVIEKQGTDELYGVFVESLMRTKTGKPEPEALSRFIKNLLNRATDAEKENLKRKGIDDGECADRIRDYYLEHYPTRSKLEPTAALRSAARATAVVGGMLEGLSNKYNRVGPAARWVTRLGAIFWGLVEVAVPRSFPNTLFRYWLQLLYLFEGLLIVAGVVMPIKDSAVIKDFGWRALGFTLVFHVAVLLLGDIMRYRLERYRAAKTILIGASVLMIGLGIIELRRLLPQLPNYLNDLRKFKVDPGSLLRIGGLLSFMCFAVIAWMGISFNARWKKIFEKQAKVKEVSKGQAKQKSERRQFMPLMLPRTKEDIGQLIGNRGDERRDVISEFIIADYFFIAVYWLLLVAMSVIQYVRASQSYNLFPFSGPLPGKLALVLSLAVAAAGTVAAVADVIENGRTLKLLDKPLSDEIEKLAAKLHRASTLKVMGACVAVVALAFTFLYQTPSESWHGYIFLVTGGLFFAGAIIAALSLIRPLHAFLGIGFLLMVVGVLIVAVLFMFFPEWVLPWAFDRAQSTAGVLQERLLLLAITGFSFLKH